MKAGDRVRITDRCKSLVAPNGALGRLEEPASWWLQNQGAWLVRLDSRDVVLVWDDELERAAE